MRRRGAATLRLNAAPFPSPTSRIDSDDIFQIYLRAKSEADAALRGNDQLDWTILRPGSLTDDSPTGKVQAGAEVEGSIPRGDVAALIATLLATGAGVGAQLEVVSGETPIAEAVAAL
ncbi:NAD(P)H-binding protein [Microcella alkalica]|uniref:NAD(P)H-binding protein n=1 Tax=Microcella alkalica TaxID=355930 RepID=UPI0015FB49DC